MSELPPLAISMGEPAGIGPDLLLRLYAQRVDLGLPPFVVFGNAGFLRSRANSIEGGTSEIQRLVIARNETGGDGDSGPGEVGIIHICQVGTLQRHTQTFKHIPLALSEVIADLRINQCDSVA